MPSSTFWEDVKVILIPPNKGDIKVRCNIATPKNFNSDGISVKKDDQIFENSHTDDSSTSNVESSNKSKFMNVINYIPNKVYNIWKKQEEDIEKIEKLEEFESDNDYTSPLDTFIGYAVDVTGSIYMLILVILILIAWVVWGAVTSAPDTWQIVMQDGQSIQTYVWDTFLMRQQLDDNEKFLILSGKLQSRLRTHRRLIKKLQDQNPDFILTDELKERIIDLDNCESDLLLHIENKRTWFDKLSEVCSKLLGNLYCVILYWIGIFVWIGCGAIPNNNGTKSQPLMQKFSNNWQMYINTAVAIELLFTSVFLEHVRARSNDVINRQIELFIQLDSDLECLERTILNDVEDNELVVVERCPRDKIQKVISFYANVIGNGLGLIITLCVFIMWFGIGNLMHWNDNWWLIIGTYTGLVGFIDGFVLREIFFSITNYEHKKYLDLLQDSQGLLEFIGISYTLKRYKPKITLDTKISLWINNMCSNKWSVIVSVTTVLGLIIMGCALLWSETAQLVANTPTMIIEGFFLLILIQAHNWADDERSNMVRELTKSRLFAHNYVKYCFDNGKFKDDCGIPCSD